MKKASPIPFRINSIAQQHQLLSLPRPEHPLVSILHFEDIAAPPGEVAVKFSTSFYSIALKKHCKCKTKYGQQYYDFDQGVMSFIAPGQVLSWEIDDEMPSAGWLLIFHPDFIQNHPLAKTVKDYGFFAYQVYEALHLSEKEEAIIESILQNLEGEYRSRIDSYSQDVIIAHIELLLQYANRFYNRQFITRKHASRGLLAKVEALLAEYFKGEQVQQLGLPTVQYLSAQLNLSPNYLSDMLRSLTGLSTQQHIHDKLIEKAKEKLITTDLTVSEIAYWLGFEHPQSFSKLFKHKTNLSPLQFRRTFN